MTLRSMRLALALAIFSGCGGTSPPVEEPTIDLGPTPDPHPASSAVQRAEALLGAQQNDEAARILVAALEANPNDPRAHFTLGVTRTLTDDAPGAESEFRAAIAIDARYAEAWNELGLLLRDTERLADGVAALGTAVQIRPDFYDAWYNLALAREDAGDMHGAREAFDSAVQGLGNDPVVRFHRAGNFIHVGETALAERELVRARTLARGRTDVLRAIARTFASMGNANEAAATLDAAVLGVDAPDANLLIEASGACRSAHRGPDALAYARRAVDAAPQSARAQAMLALVAADAGQRGEARTALDAATRLDAEGALRADLERLRTLVDAMP